MRIFIYEFTTGGGWYAADEPDPPATLLAEGRAMLTALVADFAAIEGLTVDICVDRRFCGELPGATAHEVSSTSEELATIARLSAAADWALIVAPEFRGFLLERCQAVESAGGRLLGPSVPLVALLSDKHLTAEHLALHEIGTPRGAAIEAGAPLPVEFDYPAVLKPRDGAGSLGVTLLGQRPDDSFRAQSPSRLESFVHGTAASVAVLCGPGGHVALPPASQLLSADFAYQGGVLPLPPALARRATALAKRAVAQLPDPRGYLGLDLVLGHSDSGPDDVVVEINPRITTSYVGLRALAQANLAEAMLAVAVGHPVELCWRAGPIQFDAAGGIGTPGSGSMGFL